MGLFESLTYQILRRAVGAGRGGGSRVQRDVEVAMRDGVVLLHDHWIPESTSAGRPVVLIRTPYGAAALGMVGRLFAEQGFHTVMQNTRGVFGSGGEFNPMFNEAADGLDTIGWIERQPWFDGTIHTWGLSYLGMTQWALAQQLPQSVQRMTIVVSARSFRDSVIRPGDGFGLETAVTWTTVLANQEGSVLDRIRGQLAAGKIAKACAVLPPSEAVPTAVGRRVPFVDDWLAHDIHDPWWDPVVFGQDLSAAPPTVQVAGWYDLFTGPQIADYEALRAAGRPAQLVVGPWTHADLTMATVAAKEALAGLHDPAAADRRPPVRISRLARSSGWVSTPGRRRPSSAPTTATSMSRCLNAPHPPASRATDTTRPIRPRPPAVAH